MPRTIEVTSYAEVVLAPAAADALHPAFSNLFVQTEVVPERGAILCTLCQFSTASAKPMMQQCRQATRQRPSQALLEKKPVKRWQAKVLLPRAQAKSAGRLASS